MGWLSGWAKRIELTVDNTNVDSDLSNFPVLVYVSAASGIGDVDASAVFDELTSDANRKKIAVTTSDGTTQCYVEIERWDDTNEVAWLWVKVPAVTAASNTTLYLYYDSAKADNTTYVGDTGDSPAQSVWDSNFKGGWHMAQDPSGGAGCILDSTANANHGTPGGTMTSGDLVDGVVGKALDFDGGDDYVNCGSAACLDDIVAKTVEALIYLDSFGEAGGGRIVQKASVNADGWQFLVQGGAGMNRLYFGQDWNNGTFAHWWTPTDSLTTGTWYYVAVVYNQGSPANDPLLYINGVSQSVTENVTPVGSCDSDAANDLWIGARNNSGTDREFDGKIDDVRISNIARSAAWIKATYHGNWDNLITWGAEEVEESTFIEDTSLDLSAYYCKLENLQAFLRAHDGIEFHDIQAALAAYNLSEEDFASWLGAFLEDKSDFGAILETWATQYKDLAGNFDVKGQSIESLMSQFETAKAKYKNLSTYLSVTGGDVLKDLAAFLSVTDGAVMKNLGLSLRATKSIPAFRTNVAQRVSSVVHEVS